MRIAYIGPGWGTSLQRAEALRRLGHDVTLIDPWSWLPRSRWVGRWQYHAGAMGISLFVDRRIIKDVGAVRPDLIYVDQGEFLGPVLIRELRRFGAPIVNYAIDDPFGIYGRRRFRLYRRALPFYDLAVVVREPNVSEAKSAGARKVQRVWRSADEVAHRPRGISTEQRAAFGSDVVFVGTWMSERGPFMAELIRLRVPLAIWGDGWQKASEWTIIREHWRGPAIYAEDDYAAAIQCSKICLGLLSKGNRDLHTTRSMEIPSLGGLLCAERTSEHLALYRDGTEAIFWQDAGECAALCKELLANEPRRAEIARRGHERAIQNGHFNEPVLREILKEAFATNDRVHVANTPL